jgi:uncharacterized protein Smg (DUF494 family)
MDGPCILHGSVFMLAEPVIRGFHHLEIRIFQPDAGQPIVDAVMTDVLTLDAIKALDPNELEVIIDAFR